MKFCLCVVHFSKISNSHQILNGVHKPCSEKLTIPKESSFALGYWELVSSLPGTSYLTGVSLFAWGLDKCDQ